VEQTRRLHESAHRPLKEREVYESYVPANAYLGLGGGLTINTPIPRLPINQLFRMASSVVSALR